VRNAPNGFRLDADAAFSKNFQTIRSGNIPLFFCTSIGVRLDGERREFSRHDVTFHGTSARNCWENSEAPPYRAIRVWVIRAVVSSLLEEDSIWIVSHIAE
jgi:hypothetical protein